MTSKYHLEFCVLFPIVHILSLQDVNIRSRARNSGLPMAMAKSAGYILEMAFRKAKTNLNCMPWQVKFYIDIFHFICLPQLIYTI
jgi:hypothetical protein